MTSKMEPLASEGEGYRGFAVTLEQMRDAQELLRQDRNARDRRICICGHPAGRHSEYAGRVSCTPTRMVCPCRLMVPVIEVADTRPFLRKTQGYGSAHALMSGLSGLIEKGRDWDWLPGFPVCTKCDAEGVSVYPIAIDPSGRPSIQPEARNVLLCASCVQDVTASAARSLKDSL